MPENLLHLGSSHLDFSGEFVSYSPAVSSCESNIYSAQHIEIPPKAAMEKMYTTNHVSRGEGNIPFPERQKKNIRIGSKSGINIWDKFIGSSFEKLPVPSQYLSKMNNPLSVTIVNDEILSNKSQIFENSLIKKQLLIKNKSSTLNYTPMEISFDVKEDDFFEIANSAVDHMNFFSYESINYSNKTMKMQWDDKDIIFNKLMDGTVDSYITCKDNNAMESHSAPYIHETKKSNNTMGNSLKTDSLKHTIDTKEDASMNIESFHVVSHSDVPPKSEENSISRLSNICRNAWKNLTDQLYCTMESIGLDIPRNRPRYLAKQHQRKKANAIAMGRGRGRAKCQLRRSGVSQTRHRKERTKYIEIMNIQDDYETLQTIETYCTIQDNLFLDRKPVSLDDTIGYDVPDAAQSIQQTISPIIFKSFDVTPTKQKPKAHKKQDFPTKINNSCHKDTYNNDTYNIQDLPQSPLPSENSENDFCVVTENNEDELLEARKKSKVKFPIGVRCIVDSLIKISNNCYKDNSETHDTQRNALRSRLLSESSVDSEDSFIIFKDSDDESSVCNYKITEHQTEIDYVPDRRMKLNDKDCNSETYETQKECCRSQLLSESSIDSEDSFIIFKDSDDESVCNNKMTEHPIRMRYVLDSGMEMNDKDCNSEIFDTQGDSFRSRLLSESSIGSEDSFIVFDEGNDESPKMRDKQEAVKYPIGISYVPHPSIKTNDYSRKNCNSKMYSKRNSIRPQLMSEGCDNSDYSFCIVSSTELAENCATNNIDCDKMSFYNRDNLLKDKSINENVDQNSQELTTATKKVNFNLTPVVHIMVKWDYAYRAARKGPWEEMARDTERFKGRINSIAAVLDPILTSKHRSKVWQERFAHQE